MAFLKAVVFSAILATVYAGFNSIAYHHAPPVAQFAHYAPAPVPVYPDHYPQYSFGYSVQDALTGDSKTQHETREGGVVKGSYSLVEPDGTTRIVKYTADPVHGFNAVVDRQPSAAAYKPVAAVPALPVVPAIPAAPAYRYHGYHNGLHHGYHHSY